MKKAREGYKLTEIGEIPKEWEVKKLVEVGETYNGLNNKNKDDFGYGKPYIPYKNIFNNSKVDLNYLEYVNILETEKQNKVRYGDIFFTVSSETSNELGMASVLLDEVDELYLNSFCFGFRLYNFKTLIPNFARFLLRGEYFRNVISRLAQGSTRYNLSKNELLKILIPIPPLPEQQKIADILSTVDEQIENVDKLIEKTKELKKGLMQRLLTKGIGHKEFKKTEIGVIPKEWEVKKLGEVCELINGKAFKPSEWSEEGLPIVRIQNLNGSNEFNFYQGEIEEKFIIQKDELLFSWSGSRGTSFGPFIWKGNTAVLNQHIFRVILKEIYYKKYIYYALKDLTNTIEQKAHGSAGLVHVTKKTLEEFKIKIPSLPEQQKIADILSSVDDQLEEYQAKKEKLEILKKGLMQKLLTGKIRVKC